MSSAVGQPAVGNGVTDSKVVGSLTAASGTGSLVTTQQSNLPGALVTIHGTYAGLTINFEVSDDGTTWYSTTCTRTDAVTTQETSEAVTDNATRAWYCPLLGSANFRVRASAYTSGTGSVNITQTRAVIARGGGSAGGAVSSVFTRTGAVVAAQNDYTFDLLANPALDKILTWPIGATVGLTLAGTAPASVATATGTNAIPVLTVNGVVGGADSNATGTAGIGSSPSVSAGNGGAGTGTNAVGGAGGGLSYTAGNGGASAGTGINSNGGNITFTPGTAGTGGSGTAGKSGVVSFAGANAGFDGFQQGANNTTANVQIPANTAVYQAPTSVAATYFVDVPGGGPTNNNSTWTCSNASPSICSWVKLPQLSITTGTAYTNATTTFTDVKGSTGQTLSFAAEASTSYSEICHIYWQGSATTTGPKFQWTGPASPTNVAASAHNPITTSTYLDATVTAFSTPMADTGTITITTNFMSIVTLDLVNGVNAGTVTLQAAANGVGTLTIQDSSTCVPQ